MVDKLIESNMKWIVIILGAAMTILMAVTGYTISRMDKMVDREQYWKDISRIESSLRSLDDKLDLNAKIDRLLDRIPEKK